MIVTRDRAEGFALCAFAAARRAKKEKGLVFHHDEIAYTAKGIGPASSVIPRDVERPRGATGKSINGTFSTPKLSGLKMTKTLRLDRHSHVVRRDRSARSRQPKQKLCSRDRAQRFSRVKILCRADAQ